MRQRKILQEELVERNNSLGACRNEISTRKRELEVRVYLFIQAIAEIKCVVDILLSLHMFSLSLKLKLT